MIDRKDAGRRVRLDGTDDPFSSLKRGSEGTVRYYRWSHAWDADDAAQGTLVVDWDCGSTLSLVEGLDCDVTTTGPRFGEFLAAGVAGMGVASSSGYGDGVYDVYADVVDGCVARLVIEFIHLTPVGVSRRSPDA